MTRSAKAPLPTKLCVQCKLPMTWRKKWARNWDEVKYCSERCRRAKDVVAQPTKPAR